MKTLIVDECNHSDVIAVDTFDLAKTQIQDCIGCWTCWWKTPGKCIYHDLDLFYHQYITADKVIFFSKVSKGFVSGNLKTLFDRMLPLFLPYTRYQTGESMHVPRYQSYPDIEFYYEGDFDTIEDCNIFTDYIYRVFYQFHSSRITVRPIAEWRAL